MLPQVLLVVRVKCSTNGCVLLDLMMEQSRPLILKLDSHYQMIGTTLARTLAVVLHDHILAKPCIGIYRRLYFNLQSIF